MAQIHGQGRNSAGQGQSGEHRRAWSSISEGSPSRAPPRSHPTLGSEGSPSKAPPRSHPTLGSEGSPSKASPRSHPILMGTAKPWGGSEPLSALRTCSGERSSQLRSWPGELQSSWLHPGPAQRGYFIKLIPCQHQSSKCEVFQGTNFTRQVTPHPLGCPGC